jgi:hypothetical protein
MLERFNEASEIAQRVLFLVQKFLKIKFLLRLIRAEYEAHRWSSSIDYCDRFGKEFPDRSSIIQTERTKAERCLFLKVKTDVHDLELFNTEHLKNFSQKIRIQFLKLQILILQLQLFQFLVMV